MIKIYPNVIGSVKFGSSNKENSYVSIPKQLKQIDEIPQKTCDYGIKTPMSYTKLQSMEFPNGVKAECYKLANGQRVVVIPKKGETIINTVVNTGSMNEPDNLRGISHYIEHNLFNGSEGLDAGEFFKQVNDMGGTTNASTGFAQTNYFIKSNLLNEADFEQMVKLHISMLESPKFTQEMLDKEKPIVSSEINMITQEPSNMSANRAIKNLYGIKTTSQDLIGGTVENITNLTRDDVVKYYNDNYYPANMVTVITGEVSADEAMKLMSKYVTSKKVPSKPQLHEEFKPIDKTIREDIISDKATSTTMTIALKGPENKNLKDSIALSIIMKELFSDAASRGNSKLYDIGTGISPAFEKLSSDKNANSVIMMDAESNDEKIEIALRTVFNEFENFKRQPISEEKLEEHKKVILKKYQESFQNNNDINFSIAGNMLNYDMDTIQNFEGILKSITVDDLNTVANKYLNTGKMSIVITHPKDTNETGLNSSFDKAKGVSFTGQKRTITDIGKIEAYTFPNRFEVTINDSPSDITYMNFNLKTKNTNYKNDLEGELLFEMLNKGSAKENAVQFKNSLNKDAIDFSVFANGNRIFVSGNCWNKDFNKLFEKLTEVVYSPAFTQENFDKIKENMKASILTAPQQASRNIYRELFPYSANGMTKQELLDKLDKITLEDVKACYMRILSDSQGVLTVTGNFSQDENLKDNVFKNVLKLPTVRTFDNNIEQLYKPHENTKVHTEVFNKPQAEIIEAFPFKASENIKDNLAINLLNTILGGTPSSRLFLDLREKQHLAYGVSSSVSNTDDLGILFLRIGTTTDDKGGTPKYDNVQKAIDGFNLNIKKLMTEDISEEELNNAKLSLKNSLISSVQTPEDENIKISSLKESKYGFNCLNQKLELIDSLTAEDIKAAANYIFSNKPIYSILATEDTINANKEYFSSLEQS